MNKDDELLDLVDKNDQIIGTIWRSQTANLHNENRGFIPAAEILVRNSSGKLWIPTRSLKKRIAPGGLDYSTSGHVESGESYLESAIREVKEELNLDITPESLKLLHKFLPIGDELAYIRSVYIYETDKAPQYNPEDFTGYEWLTSQELLERLKSGAPAKRSLLETVTYLINN